LTEVLASAEERLSCSDAPRIKAAQVSTDNSFSEPFLKIIFSQNQGGPHLGLINRQPIRYGRTPRALLKPAGRIRGPADLTACALKF
jgi:hypothetical protein